MTDQDGISLTRTAGCLGAIAAVIVVAMIFTGAATAADVTSAERSIEQTEVAPGESTTVTVEVGLNETGDPAIYEEFDPAFENVEIVDADPIPTVSAVRDSNDELVAIWNESQTATIEYEVTVPENASNGDSFNITGDAESAERNISITGDTQIEVVDEDFDVSIVDIDESVEQGDMIETTAEIENIGGTNGTQDIEFRFDGELLGTEENVSLGSGDSETVTFTADTTDVELGQYEVAVSSDDDEATSTVEVTQPPEEAFFDITITDTNSPVEAGEDLETIAEIENTGDLEGTQDLEFLVNGSVEAIEDNVTLAGGDNETQAFTLDTTGVEPGEYDVTISSDNDTDTTSVEVTQPPEEAFFDVAITDTDGSVEAGEDLQVTAEIENTGDLEGTQDLEFLFNESVEAVEEDVMLAGGNSETVTFTADTTGVEPGEYDVAVSSDDDEATSTIEVTSPPEEAFFDVAITGTNSPVESGEDLEVTAEIENTGDLEGTQGLELLLNGTSEAVEETITLAGGDSETVTFTANTTGLESGDYEATIRSQDASDTNTVKITSPPEEAFFDVAITDADSSVEAGEDLEVTAEIENTGDLEGTQDIEFLFNSSVEGVEENLTLTGGESETRTFTVDTTDVGAGEYEIAVSSDDDEATSTVEVTSPPEEAFFDVAITDTNSPVEVGDNLEVTTVIENTGDLEATQDLKFLFNGSTEAVEENVTLAGGDNTTVTFTYDTSDLEPNEYDIEVQSDTDADNGTVTVTESEPEPEPPTQPSPPEEAFFDVEITDTEDSAKKGKRLVVNATVTNTGDKTGDQDIQFLFNGEIRTIEENVTITGGETKSLSFTADTAVSPGKYETAVKSDDDTATTKVKIASTKKNDDTETESDADEEETKSGTADDEKDEETEPDDETETEDDDTFDTTNDSTENGSDDSTPGFGIPAVIIGLMVALFVGIRQRK